MPKAASNSRSSGPQPTTRSAPYPLPKPKANDTSTLTEKSATSINAAAKQTPPTLPSSKPTPQSFLDLELSGESDHSVPIYETCTVIRTKISNIVNRDHKPENAIPNESIKNGEPKYWNVRAFVEALGHGVSEKKYRTFMKKSGVMAGAESEVYYAAYCFFEKKKVWEGKAKSAARKKAEVEHPHGFKLFDPTKPRAFLMRPGEKLGRGAFQPMSARGPCANCGKHSFDAPAP